MILGFNSKGRKMTDDNIISIDGRRQADQLRKDHAELEKREKLLREKLERIGLDLWTTKNAPGRYWIADLRRSQPEHLRAWSNLSLEQVEEAIAHIGDSAKGYHGNWLRPVTVGKPWREKLPQCHLNNLEHINKYYADVGRMCDVLECFRRDVAELPESEPYVPASAEKHWTKSTLSADAIMAAIVLLEAAREKLIALRPIEETMSPESLAAVGAI
jgi:hypothetical protein